MVTRVIRFIIFLYGQGGDGEPKCRGGQLYIMVKANTGKKRQLKVRKSRQGKAAKVSKSRRGKVSEKT